MEGKKRRKCTSVIDATNCSHYHCAVLQPHRCSFSTQFGCWCCIFSIDRAHSFSSLHYLHSIVSDRFQSFTFCCIFFTAPGVYCLLIIRKPHCLSVQSVDKITLCFSSISAHCILPCCSVSLSSFNFSFCWLILITATVVRFQLCYSQLLQYLSG